MFIYKANSRGIGLPPTTYFNIRNTSAFISVNFFFSKTIRIEKANRRAKKQFFGEQNRLMTYLGSYESNRMFYKK